MRLTYSAADLHEADLCEADLLVADPCEADLHGTDLHEADLSFRLICMKCAWLIFFKLCPKLVWLSGFQANEANLYKGEFFLTDVCHTFEGGFLLEWLFDVQLLDRLG